MHDLIIEALFEYNNTPKWDGTATDLESELFSNGRTASLRDISPSVNCTGRYLTRLEEKKDEPHVRLEVTYTRNMHRRSYQIELKRDMTA